jgi:hypothetical protein
MSPRDLLEVADDRSRAARTTPTIDRAWMSINRR